MIKYWKEGVFGKIFLVLFVSVIRAQIFRGILYVVKGRKNGILKGMLESGDSLIKVVFTIYIWKKQIRSVKEVRVLLSLSVGESRAQVVRFRS